MFENFEWLRFLTYLLIGSGAQLIDGSLGMAYGVSANAFLLAAGQSPVVASASIHISEVFTTFASGISHFKFKNTNRALIQRLIIPGVVGGLIGAYLLVNIATDIIKPFIAAYLLIMGVRIFLKAFNDKQKPPFEKLHLITLGLFGGFFDAVGGGGWGPIVTTTLLSREGKPRQVIGSVNIAEFFVTLAQAILFIVLIGMTSWPIILGLIVGGVLAAPLAAYLTAKLPTKALFVVIGSLIVLLQVRFFLNMIGVGIF